MGRLSAADAMGASRVIPITAQKSKGVGPSPLRTNWRSPNSKVPAEETKRDLWRERGYLIIDMDDPRVVMSWVDREYLTAVGNKLYGARRAAVQQGDRKVSSR